MTTTNDGAHAVAAGDGRTSELIDAQLRAVEMSGRARKFRFFQPRNLCWWVFVAAVAYGVLSIPTVFAAPVHAFGSAIAGSIALLLIYGAVLWWFTRHIDRYSPISGSLVAAAMAWGGAAATLGIAIWANTPIISLYAKAFGQNFAADWGAGLTAPFVEEIAKGLGVVLLMFLATRVIRTAFDGFVVGAFVGLGFQISEDILYAFNQAGADFGVGATTLALETSVVRIITGLSGHIAFSAMFGAGLVYLIGRRGEPRNAGRGLALMGLAILLHGIWDSQSALLRTSSTVGALLATVVLVLVYLAIVIMVFRSVVVRERELLRAILAPEAANGILDDAELTAITGDAKHRRQFRKTRGGRAAVRREKWVTAAASDLADQIALAGGRDTAAVRFARSEVVRIRQS
ncbi:PrsW family intramembrane metalloprotease [Rhodococcus sp. NBC_00294]|uniref:PrsW family intramembrane metalloprotease n=1 Tax=Rhodococcus sp. NBC_00294 TaxID=2976004 RepID=UPI002E2B6312|nr:PrsW family intramembrane metalloprotease [Rhodococcus sp. NBC_00294]